MIDGNTEPVPKKEWCTRAFICLKGDLDNIIHDDPKMFTMVDIIGQTWFCKEIEYKDETVGLEI